MPALLYPEDIGPKARDDILAALNAAGDAATLAAAIDFSEGLQVGRELAAALLAARPASGFADLDSVLAVPRISVARFTEIASALSSARPPSEGRQLRLEIRAGRGELWLGQGTRLLARLLDESGRGLQGRTLTLTASTGVLSGSDGRRIQGGSALVARTGRSGIFEFGFGPAVSPPLSLAETEALEAALGRLPLTGRRVWDAAEALAELVALYRGSSGAEFRRAVDRLFAAMPVDPVDAQQLWPTRSATIVGLVGGSDAGPGAADLVTSRTLVVRDWLGAWLAVLEAAIATDRRAEPVLDALSRDREVDILTRNVVAVTQAFGSLEMGEVGARIRDRETGARLNRYLASSVDRLGGEALTSLVRDTGTAAAAIRAGGLTVFKAADASAQVNRKLAAVDLGDLRADLGRFGERLATVEGSQLDRGALDSLRAEIGESLGAFTSRVDALEQGAVDRTTLDARFEQVTGRLGALEERQVDRADLDTRFEQVTERLDGLESSTVDRDLFESRLAAVTGRLSDFEEAQIGRDAFDALSREVSGKLGQQDLDARLSRFEEETGVGALAGRLDALETRVVGRDVLDAELQAIRGRVAGIEASQVRRSDLDALATRLADQIERKADRVLVDERFAGFDGATRTDLAAVTDRLAAVEVAAVRRGDLAVLADQLAGLEARAKAADQLRAEIDDRTRSVLKRVDELEQGTLVRSDFEALRKEATTAAVEAARAELATAGTADRSAERQEIARLESALAEMGAQLERMNRATIDAEAMRTEIRASILREVSAEAGRMILENRQEVDRLLAGKADSAEVARLSDQQKVTDQRLSSLAQSTTRPRRT